MGENEDHGQDEHVDPDAATATVATRLTTLPPVQNVSDLPGEAAEGTICFVHSEGTSFLYADGAWSSGSSKGED